MSSTRSGAQASYRGYRLQALYTLHRLLCLPAQKDSYLQPEGLEDVDIFAEGRLMEAVQVKSYPSLSFKHFSAGKEKPLLMRIKDYLAIYPDITVTIANFGLIGTEIDGAWKGIPENRKTISNKLTEAGYSATEVTQLFKQVRLVSLNEISVRYQVFRTLQDLVVGVDAEIAFDLLVFWLYIQAESSSTTTSKLLTDRLSAIGKFLSEQRAYHQEWFVSITPLNDHAISSEQSTSLRNEFNAGIATRYEHIIAELDIAREHHITELHSKWQKTNVVILRAASGQGKSTIALRYIHDFYPDQWKFKVEIIQDRLHALRVARALSGFAEGVKAPMIVYLDISPRDTDWPELVQRLVALPYLRILVSVREEDFQRAGMTGAGFSYEEISLTFDRAEAQKFYKRATLRMNLRFIDFDEAWTFFGSSGPLLEFVYLLTETKSLRDRLSTQIKRFRNEIACGTRHPSELQVLQTVAVITAYEARVSVAKLQDSINHPDLFTCISGLEKEYLLRVSQDGQYLEGLHPVRSGIISGLLCDTAMSPWVVVTKLALKVMVEADAEAFLFRALIERPELTAELLAIARERRWASWSGFSATLRAHAWSLIRAKTLSPREESQTLSRETVRWLERARVNLPASPQSDNEWAGLSWTWNFLASARIKPGLFLRVTEHSMNSAVRTLPLQRLGQIALGLYRANSSDYESWLRAHRTVILSRLAEEYGILYLADKEGTLTVHYKFEFGQRKDKDHMDPHAATMERIWLIRQLFPSFLKYGAHAYGHGAGHALPMFVDDTEKTGIPANQLPPPFEFQTKRLERNLRTYANRLDSWNDFAEAVLKLRFSNVSTMQAINNWDRTTDCVSLPTNICDAINDCRSLLNKNLYLPKQAVDSAGFGSEDEKSGESSETLFAERALLLQRYRPFFSAYRDFTISFGNFLFQIQQTSKSERDAPDDNVRLSALNLHNARAKLTTLQSQFRQMCGHLVEDTRLNDLEVSEKSSIDALWSVWLWTVYQKSDEPKIHANSDTLIPDIQKMVMSHFNRACLTFSTSKAKATVHLFEAIRCDTIIWIELSFEDPRRIGDHGKTLLLTLHEEFSAISLQNTTRFVIEDRFQNVYIVPTYKGSSIDRCAWQFLTLATLFGPLKLEDPQLWWKWLRRPQSDDFWQDLHLAHWNTSELSLLRSSHESLTGMWILQEQTNTLCHVPELTSAGKTVVGTAIKSASEQLVSLNESVVQNLDELTHYWDELSEEEQDAHPAWQVVVSEVGLVYDLINPSEVISENEISFAYSYGEQLMRSANIVEDMILWWLCDVAT